MLNIVEKDITTVEFGIVAHGVNCQHKMASGVAKAIRNKWPKAYEDFMSAPNGQQMLGKVRFVQVEDDKPNLFVANCYTQLYYGYNGGKYASIEAVETSLYPVFKTAKKDNLALFVPQIGCGLGGLDWSTEVYPMLLGYATMFADVDTYVCIWPPKNKE